LEGAAVLEVEAAGDGAVVDLVVEAGEEEAAVSVVSEAAAPAVVVRAAVGRRRCDS